jgi:hypothetical protein
VAALIALFATNPDSIPGGTILMQKATGKYTVADRLAEFGPIVKTRWQPYFLRAGLSYPPQRLLLLGLKEEKRLEIYASNGSEGDWKWVRSLPIQRASGKAGPKLREGDMQVPEGFYKIESLNPNSAFHLALRVNYPSPTDREIAEREGRTELGGNIMIHGGAASIGCLAMGDEAAEDLFVLAAQTGRENIEVALCPLDFRTAKLPADPERPQWLKKRYAELADFVQTLPRDSP